jgi:tRNA threonylcarbamoyladenosine biosynthesis protein TsaE
MSLTITTASADETLALGRRLAAVVAPGDIVLLEGRLGAGKTLFVSGVAEGLGIADRITSPTFVISHIHRQGFLPLIHADVYRLGSVAEFDDLELPDEALDGVLLIEWGGTVAESIGEDHLAISIEITSETERTITFEPSGTWKQRNLDMLT